jgi:hypothetical protein
VLDIKVLFIDDGGVMNDNTRRTPQLRRLVGEYFARWRNGIRRGSGACARPLASPHRQRIVHWAPETVGRAKL